MTKASKFLGSTVAVLLSLTVLLFSAGFLWNAVTSPSEKIEVTSQSVLDRITDQYFVVTKTAFVDQETSIVVDRGTTWSNFLWGQTITADARIRVDIGVDLSELSLEDVQVDRKTKIVSLTLPEAKILDASLFGDIDVTTQKGFLSRFIGNDPNEDHNLAASRLINDARTTIEQDAKLFKEARDNSLKLLQLIVGDFGYELEIN